MDYVNLVLIILMAISYYLFSDQFFKFSAEIKEEKISFTARFLSFVLIYAWFITASFLELPLVVNWLGFLVILVLEVHFVFSFDYLISFAVSLFCVITGLASNVLFRSLASIVMDVPLTIFDKTQSYLKAYPIFLGFMVMVLLLFVLRRSQFTSRLKQMLRYRKSLHFYTWTEVSIYLFLIIQLLVFTQTDDLIAIKIWGIKSTLFSSLTLVITIIYTIRVASLHYYMDKQHEVRTHLIQEKKDINKLWNLAYTDMLTGFSNRQLLDKRLEEYAGYGGKITLAFIDVNGLKHINDQYGHMEGDNYLVSITQTLSELVENLNIDLFRYGGDEFVMMSNTLDENQIRDLLVRANVRLGEKTTQYVQSVSYGVVRGESADYQKLIMEADDAMYQYKMKYYEVAART